MECSLVQKSAATYNHQNIKDMNRITIALAVLGTLAVPASAQKKYGEIRPDTAKVRDLRHFCCKITHS